MRQGSAEPERDRVRLAVAVGVATRLSEVLQTRDGLRWGNHLPVAAVGLLNDGLMRDLPATGFIPCLDKP